MSNARIQDEADCTHLAIDFFNHIDARRYQQVLDLFTEDGVLDRMGTASHGRGEIERFLTARSETVQTRHLCTNVRVHFNGEDQAEGFSYALFFQAQGEGVPVISVPPSVVEYRDRFVRTPEGWRIRERRIAMAMRPAPIV
ncbi:MAG: nuclear transport factor 2 family protein [Gammaproteobacteria bacterium]|nr:nuclear transport factor 2 family protein [Gammaproteobacteria bacterium]